MDPTKDNLERFVGENFIRWYNQQHSTRFAFRSRQENPDLSYQDGGDVLHVEVSSAYYDDQDHAKFLWQNAREDPKAPGAWDGVNFDAELITNINQRLAEKSTRNYGSSCMLVVEVTPILTGDDEFEKLLSGVIVPPVHHFAGIYVTGHFPQTSTSDGGYRCWRLDRQ